MEEQVIQFIANYKDWIAVKKLKITESTDPLTIMEFLASLTNSVDRKVEENLRKIVSLEKVDSFLKVELEGAKSETGISKALAAIKGAKLGKIIDEITEKITDNSQKKEINSFIRFYATRKALKELGLAVDYSCIESPQMKKLMKKKG